MKRLLLSALFSCILSCLLAQDRTSWLSQLDTAADSSRPFLYLQIANSYRGVNYDSGFYYARVGLKLAEELDDSSGRMKLLNMIGVNHFFVSNLDSAIFYYNLVIPWAQQLNDSIQLGATISNIGMTYVYKAEYDTAIEVLMRAREIRMLTNDPKLSSTINNIGIGYMRLKDYEKALVYFEEAALLKLEHDQLRSLSNTYNNIGIINKRLGNYDEAISYYLKSLDLAVQFNDKNKEASAHNNLATLNETIGNFNLSEEHYLKAIELKIKINDRIGLYNSYSNYAILLSKNNQLRKALEYIEKASDMVPELGDNIHTAGGLNMKANILAQLGRTEEAYEVMREAFRKRVDEMNQDRNEKIAELEVQFETAQKEAEIVRLQLEKDLAESNLRRSRNTQIMIATISGLLIVTMVVIFYLRSKKQQAEKLAQELQIEALRKRIIEVNAVPADLSLNYEEINERLHTPLTEREFEALELSLDGKTNTEISEKLFISVSTVKFHLRNTYTKLGVTNRKEAFEYVVKNA